MKKKFLTSMNTILAGVVSMLGFQSCDKDDDIREEKCMYGPAPMSYQSIEEDDFQTPDSNDSAISLPE